MNPQCGPGRFLLKLASSDSSQWSGDAAEHGRDFNFLGLEIREPIVERARKWSDKLGVGHRVAFMKVNATLHMASLLSNYPGRVHTVCCQFPDPHFKRKHHKRRIVQERLVRDLAARMDAGGRVFLQSDVHEVSDAMRDAFEYYGGPRFDLHPIHLDIAQRIRSGDSSGVTLDEDWLHRRMERDLFREEGSSRWRLMEGEGWLPENPLGVPTEREILTQKSSGSVYRTLLVRTAEQV